MSVIPMWVRFAADPHAHILDAVDDPGTVNTYCRPHHWQTPASVGFAQPAPSERCAVCCWNRSTVDGLFDFSDETPTVDVVVKP